MLHKSMINIQFDSSFALPYSPVFNSFLFGIFSAFGIYIYIYIYIICWRKTGKDGGGF